jgi:hypothetical protein
MKANKQSGNGFIDAFLLMPFVYFCFNMCTLPFQKCHNFVFSHVNPVSMSAFTFKKLSFLSGIILVLFDFASSDFYPK